MNIIFLAGFALVAVDLFSTIMLSKPIIKAGWPDSQIHVPSTGE